MRSQSFHSLHSASLQLKVHHTARECSGVLVNSAANSSPGAVLERCATSPKGTNEPVCIRPYYRSVLKLPTHSRKHTRIRGLLWNANAFIQTS